MPSTKSQGQLKTALALRFLATIIFPILLLVSANYRVPLPTNHRDATAQALQDVPQPQLHPQPVLNAASRGAGLDFAVAGFPKTGTTFLLGVLGDHPDIVMPRDEFCSIHKTTSLVTEWLRRAALTNSSSARRYGIKCPSIIRRSNAVDHLVKMSDRTRLIVGVRHPVLWFQSFYNYRVWEHHSGIILQGQNESLPSPLTLMGGKREWNDVWTAFAKFDVYLKQLAKVAIAPHELNDMLASERLWLKRISPNPFKIFLFETEQLHDKNSTRQIQFRLDLQEFLALETPIINFNKVTKGKGQDLSAPIPGQIDICEQGYAVLRRELLNNGIKSKDWIISKFIESNDVVVSSKDHFSSMVRRWAVDPCLSTVRFSLRRGTSGPGLA